MQNEALIADLIRYVAAEPRTYPDVMAAWRTSCPRLTIWEDALDLGFVVHRARYVEATPAGTRFLALQS